MTKNNKKKERVKEPIVAAFLFSLISKIYLALFYKVKINREVLKKQKRGYLFLFQ